MKTALPQTLDVSASHLDTNKQPGHWLLANLGKRVLRPGGLEVTRQLIAHLRPASEDDVVEFAPGLGVTARMILANQPRSYLGVEREEAVAHRLRSELAKPNVRFIHASAESTALAPHSASLVYGEAMLSMQTPEQKGRIVTEAFRLLKPGGRYGIHELAILPDDIDDSTRKAIERKMSMNIHVGVRPATISEWRQILEGAGFQLDWQILAPMHLLEPKRILSDEGIGGCTANHLQSTAEAAGKAARTFDAADIPPVRIPS
jgi:SAM-dependent methyltransferase